MALEGKGKTLETGGSYWDALFLPNVPSSSHAPVVPVPAGKFPEEKGNVVHPCSKRTHLDLPLPFFAFLRRVDLKTQVAAK